MKIHKNDKVKILKGKDRGKDGIIDRVFPKGEKVVIAGINLFKRHMKPRAEGQKGQIVEVPRPLPVANVALICPKCHMVTRAGYLLEKGKKVRVCKKCKMEI
ncbi:50S ribosomal protein L24 [Candidatus Gottesmanbacteria bacterium RIFCSPHIGHO2_01_FULL_42_12]|uniref:Large ribosomal subunit protein uL24 n=1 Tax=Candidatus Gottesmanbacteria bacterium RIFCSPHIGHO2_01_FULL_42_12 TaxID=1798377 RepID=A0A1F5Z4K1_9BACT|nr:MAG: 50S ribosomal protein L24 [Candidatus Gottesmanbacteria bacterium RIFCSPHIGHO2_01_FULL_42_12]